MSDDAETAATANPDSGLNASYLAREIAAMIVQDGPMSVERYMGLCLAHPVHGYYMTRDPLGADGDFVTSPEISQMFGELLGLWAAETWRLLGAQQPAHLAELGPGRGTLMADALRAARAAPDFYRDLGVTMVETSPPLQARQQRMLAGAERPIEWVDAIERIAPGAAIILANEFFDALPVRHYIKTAEGWRERQVGLVADKLAFGAAEAVEPYLNVEAADGAILEVGAVGQRIMTALAARIVQQGGALLVVDYGHARTAFGETLQAMRDHTFVDPLECPGEADLTTHIDFAGLARAARAAGARAHGPVTQGAFLRQIGIVQRAQALSAKANREQAAEIERALARLTAEDAKTDMGRLFKVMAITRASVEALPGFIEGIPA
ncbi:MAG: class I SAM-dependent methyltransferase [Rhodoblastus sp.]